jgi:hypothetical protein
MFSFFGTYLLKINLSKNSKPIKMDDENKFLEEIEKLKNSKEGKDHIKLGKYYTSGCYIPINLNKAFEEYKLANELDNKIGYAEMSDHYLGYNKKERNEEKGMEFLEKGISMNDLNSKLALASYLVLKNKHNESKKLFEELIEQKHYPGYVEYGKLLIYDRIFAFEDGADKTRAMKLILEAANEGEDKGAILFLLDSELFKKDYKKYINLKFLEDRYFEYKSKLYEDINKKVKIWKQGVKFNSTYCIDELISYHGEYSECPDTEKEAKYIKKGFELNSWISYYWHIDNFYKNNDMKKVEKYINQYNEISDSIEFHIINFLQFDETEQKIKLLKKIIKESKPNF